MQPLSLPQVVDVEAIKELAAVYKVEPVILSKMAHDCMLVSERGECLLKPHEN